MLRGSAPLRIAVVIVSLGLVGPSPAVVSAAEGIVESPDWGECQSPCNLPSHQLYDLCRPRARGNPADLDPSPADEMDAYLCRHVVLDGPQVCGTCCGTDPSTVVETPPTCSNEIQRLRFPAASGTFTWERRPCALSYDAIRGLLPSASPGVLGAVTCLSDDQPQAGGCVDFLEGEDGDIPPVGWAFFYLVRANGAPYGGDSYGYATGGGERIPAAGDCLATPSNVPLEGMSW